MAFFTELVQIILNIVWKQTNKQKKKPNTQKKMSGKEKQNWRNQAP